MTAARRGAVFVVALLLGGCGGRAGQPPAPAPETTTPVETAGADDGPLAPLTSPPVEGISYWAKPTLRLDTYLRAAGLGELERIEVSNPKALIRALGSNRVIVLTPGDYIFEDSNKLGDASEKAALPRWSTLSSHYNDDGAIHDLENLVIASAGPAPAVLLQPDTYAHALSFLRVKGVRLHNLVIGHRPEKGFCRGGVVKVVEGQNIVISESTLFGSGTEGLTLISVDGLDLVDSVITDTTEQFSTISHSRNVLYDGVEIVGNVGDLLRGFAIYRSQVTVKDSIIADNKALSWEGRNKSYGMLFYVDGDYDIGKWHVDAPKALTPAISKSTVTLENVKVDGASTSRVIE